MHVLKTKIFGFQINHDTWRWDLWEVIRHEGGSLINGIEVAIDKKKITVKCLFNSSMANCPRDS